MPARRVTAPEAERFGRLLERADGDDFPFYNGVPLRLSWWRWLVMLAGTAGGFLIITHVPTGDDRELLPV